MIDRSFFLDRNDLSRVFNNPTMVRKFETLQESVATSAEASTAAVEATQTQRDATYVTLSANAELPNERVLAVGAGLSLDIATAGQVRLIPSVYTEGGWQIQFVTVGATSLALPTSGFLATRAGVEALSNKTLAAPKLSGLVNAVDDAAAASGGVPVGGIYRDGSNLKVRVA
jgi:hypothetical protein